MATSQLNHSTANTSRPTGFDISQVLPFLDWLFHYRRENLMGDLLAGIIVTIMIVPQGMAYALLAGLPPEAGLYASIAPMIVYGLLGTSRTLSVGPVAIDSLLVAAGLSQFEAQGSTEYIALALTLALMIGLIQVGLGILRAGFLVNFLSHPVLSGFLNAAALVIAASQLKHLLGINIPRYDYLHETLRYAGQHLGSINLTTLAIGAGSIGLMFYFKGSLITHLGKLGLADQITMPISKSAPLVVVVLSTLLVWSLGLHKHAGVDIVGEVPAGLPALTLPSFDLAEWEMLLSIALTIALVGYMESISIAKSLASKRREKIKANNELLAIGMSNMSAAVTGGFPVTGGLSRSVVNYSAGANTGLAAIITATLVGVVLLFFTPLFEYLPNAVLAAIILVAVANLLDLSVLKETWRYNKADAMSLVITFFAVLALGIQNGILIGVGAALALYLWRTSRPHVAVVGRLGESEHFRNVMRYETQTCDHIIALRVDESLYFANTQYLENVVLNMAADNPALDHLVLVCSGVNFIDTSALRTLDKLIDELAGMKIQLYLAEVKGPVMDNLRKTGFIERLGAERIYISTFAAMKTLDCIREDDYSYGQLFD